MVLTDVTTSNVEGSMSFSGTQTRHPYSLTLPHLCPVPVPVPSYPRTPSP